jgi:hypothetical protein
MSDGVRLVGDWRKLRHRLDRFSEFGEAEADRILYECAEVVKNNMLDFINSEPSPNNAESTIRRKGFDAPLYETGKFREDSDTISISDITFRGAHGYVVGGNPNMYHDRSKSSYENIVLANNDKYDILSIAYDRSKKEIESIARTSLNNWLFSDEE